MPEGFDMADITGIPSWAQYNLSARSLLVAFEKEDPEDTLMAQLTTPEFGLTVLGLMLLQRFFPEFRGVCGRLTEKFADLAGAQEFFGGPSNEGDE